MAQRTQEQRPSSSAGKANAEPSNAERERAEGPVRHAAADWTETDNDDEDSDDEAGEGQGHAETYGGSDEATSLLPVFSTGNLDTIPVYSVTHAIRLMVLPRSETTLSWDQLRSPQVSQFLIKPIQQQILASHFSRATLYALMANCLQFGKEAQTYPGDAGTSRTRAMVCELLAIKMLREYNTRELIDALSYGFYPLQGLGATESLALRSNREQTVKLKPATARVSTLEVAIRAQAKRFLAHPRVNQQLQAIWAGTIVFHSAADHLHHKSRITPQERYYYGATARRNPLSETFPNKLQREEQWQSRSVRLSRQVIGLYSLRDASLFKLSRLRVPRYRQFFSTCSLIVLLSLYLAVLSKKSSEITALEVLFWFWSAGFMLDQVVGLNEQGYTFYILSFWNSIDIGMLLFLTIYYCLRLYGIFVVDVGKEEWDSMAYEVLAASAVLLFPRLLGILDRYQYFSQLLIAFRLMLVDLAALFVLISVVCSGFFVAFTMAFSGDYGGNTGAYLLFQVLLGFTPAAWNVWPEYNLLGKTILTLFLFISHFLIVTILITVLTNSFMASVSNANEEHQFVFAVNTITMVKNDALFSYVAPCNILAWFLTPLRFLLPFRQFVKLNRYVIKATHFPLLFGIYVYEKFFLARSIIELTDLIENQGRRQHRTMSFMDSERVGLFSLSLRARQESEWGYQKDKALEDVFRLNPPETTLRSTIRGSERRQGSSIVTNWIDQHDGIATLSPEQERAIFERLGKKKQAPRRQSLARWDRDRRSRRLSGTRSVGSGPVSTPRDFAYPNLGKEQSAITAGGHTGDEGDDELLTNEEDENISVDRTNHGGDSNAVEDDGEDECFQTPTITSFTGAVLSAPEDSTRPHSISPPVQQTPSKPRQADSHSRNLSSTTILYNPVAQSYVSSPKKVSTSPSKTRLHEKRITAIAGGLNAPTKCSTFNNRPHPTISTRSTAQSSPIRTATSPVGPKTRPSQSIFRRSSLDMKSFGFVSDASFADTEHGAIPSGFATQITKATGIIEPGGSSSTDGIMGRLMLARMKILEEGFQEVLKEVRELRAASSGVNSPADTTRSRDSQKSKGNGKGTLRNKGRSRSAGAGGDDVAKENAPA